MATNDRYTPNDRQPENDYRNPVGSVDIYGTGGSVRHRGYFSQDNPWLDDMTNGAKNQDIDAAYERAVNWEADRSTLLEQRAYDEARLAEQREYDSPLQQIARERAAGINRDVAGGSGSAGSSGSSAQLQSLPQPQTQAQTKFSNSYDNANLVFAGINSVSSFISALSGAAGTVMNGIAQFKKLPSEIGLAEAQSNLVNAQANEVNTLLSGKQTAQEIANNSSYLSQLAQIAQLTKADISDESLSPFLSSVGLSEEQLPGAMSVVRELHSNPEALAKYFDDSNKLRKSKLTNELVTEDYLRNFMQVEQSVAFNEILGQHYLSAITKTINKLLYQDESYAENIASAKSTSAAYSAETANLALDSVPFQRSQLDYNSQTLELAKEKLTTEINTFMTSLQCRHDAIDSLRVRRADLRKSFEGKVPTFFQQSIDDSLSAQILALQTMNCNQFAQMHHYYLRGCLSHYQNNHLDDDGQLRYSDSFMQTVNNFASTTYFSLFPTGMTMEQRVLSDRDYVLNREKYMQQFVNLGLNFVGNLF